MSITTSAVSAEITFRIVTQLDAAKVRGLRLEALSRHPEAFAADYDLTAAEDAGKWSERIAEYEQTHSSAIFIANTGDSLVGMAGIGRGHWPKTRHSAFLWGVYVQPAWRGRWIGGQLVNSCVQWGKQNGISVVKLGVALNNTQAIKCYERCGFRVYGSEPKALYFNGKYYDELLMALTIG